jgi:hypothetical protein
MALIEEYMVVADHYPVNSAVTDLIEGMFVKLNTAGEVIKATGAANERAIGVCGDTKSTSQSGLPSTNASSMGAFVNRVSDSFDETKASGRATVYHSGGKFLSNQYVLTPAVPWAVGLPLYVSSLATLTTDIGTATQVVATCVQVPSDVESGVPGIDVRGSLTLGNYVEFKLEI